jgi:hypothetical protein
MSEEKQERGTLRDEFRNLGENLKEMVNSAWESEERSKANWKKACMSWGMF